METNDLIDQLAKDLEPVAPLWQPHRRAAVWCTGATLYVGILALAMAQGRAAENVVSVRFWLPQIAAVVASFLAARAAFTSVVPGYGTRVLAWLGLAALIWLGSLVVVAPWQAPLTTILGARHEWACVAVIVIGGAPLLFLLAAMLRRGAPLTPLTTAASAMLAVGTLANIAACLSLPHASNEVTFVWHGATVVALVALAALGARLVFTWRRVSS